MFLQYTRTPLKYFSILIACFFLNTLTSQNIRINEVVSSNSTYLDEDGDTSDWIELYNYGTTPISLLNWGLTDDIDDLHSWQFPDVTLNSDEYLLVWASDKNITELSYARTLVNQGDTHNYLIPTTEPDTNWNTKTFDDSTWESGPSGFGYGDDDDATEIPEPTNSVYTRITFTMEDLSNLTQLILDVDYDDAFVAYINGVEVARANIDGTPPAYDDNANDYIEPNIYTGGSPERFIVDNADTLLTDGENVLAIQVHNYNDTSSDLTLIPFLSAIFSSDTSIGITPPEILNLIDGKLHTNFKVSSSSEDLYLSDSDMTIVDSVLVENLASDTSLGVSKVSGTLVTYIDTTPELENSDSEYLGSVTSTVVFSNESGILDSAINLSLSGNNTDEVIRYTTDTSAPTEDDLIYEEPILIDTNTVIRAQIFKTNYIPSTTYNKSYVLNIEHEIDKILITVDSEDFFNEETGIYVYGPEGSYEEAEPHYGANFWEDWERPVHFSFYEKGSNEIAVEYNGGVKIFGGWSRANDQRSLSFFARSAYGASEFEYPFFEQLEYDEFQSFVLRNSGNDWIRTSIKDITLTSLMRGTDLEFQEYNPVATYLNGEYWGMYNMREKNNEHMLASKHNIDSDDITLLEKNAEVVEGSNDEYNALIDYVSNTDLSIDENFEYVSERVDLMNYALYMTSNIYFNNTDWPNNNIKFWTHPGGKWRWILYDTDFGFGPFWDTQTYDEDALDFILNEEDSPNSEWSTLLFRKLNTNIGFRNLFINRYADELNTRFLPDYVKTHIDDTELNVISEIEAHYDRWDGSIYEMEYLIDEMKNFAEFRPAYAKEYLLAQYDLPAIHTITIENNDITQGYVRLNSNLEIQEASWTGDYFETVPIELTAVAESGYAFTHWSGDISSTEATISVSLEEANSVTPNFEEVVTEAIVINEINYKSGETADSDDWIELYNPNSFVLDISNWQLKDDDDTHVFNIPTGTTIQGNSFIVLVTSTEDFTSVFPTVTNFIGDIDFGFGGTDSVRLYNADSELQDEVNYSDESPWVTCPDETGQTLELISPELDNSLAENWNCLSDNGSPNAINALSTTLSIDDITNSEYPELKIFPNPTSSTIYFSGITDINAVQIINLAGQEVLTIENPEDEINVKELQSGLYLIKVKLTDNEYIYKFIKN